MFKIFNKKDKTDSLLELDKRYRHLMYKWHKLTEIDVKASEEVFAQAQLVLKQIVLKKAL